MIAGDVRFYDLFCCEIGIAKAKAEGKYKGKQANLAKHAEGKDYLGKGYSVSEIVKPTEMGKVSRL